MKSASSARKISRSVFNQLKIVGLGVALCVAALPAAAGQNPSAQNGDIQTAPPSQDPQAMGQPDAPAQLPPDNRSQDQMPPSQPGQPSQAVLPQTLTVPAGTVVRVRVDDWLSSDRSVTGDSFSAVLEDPIVVGGWVVARRGQAQSGRVTTVKKGRSSALGVDLPELTLVDGQQLPLQTQLFQASGGSPDHGRDVAIVGTTTGMGAVIGEIAGGGVGAAIGAGIGATAGIIGVKSTDGRPAVIAPETVLSFRLQAPVTISTANSQFAFQPVTQSDYDSHSREGRPRMANQGPPRPYYSYPYPYPYAYGYPYPWYPTPFIGFGYYGGYGRFGRWR
jgi:hypothetical protein